MRKRLVELRAGDADDARPRSEPEIPVVVLDDTDRAAENGRPG